MSMGWSIMHLKQFFGYVDAFVKEFECENFFRCKLIELVVLCDASK